MVKNFCAPFIGVDKGNQIRESLQQIAFELQESGATKWQALKILKGLEGAEITEQQLRRKASEMLSALNPEAAKTFSSFERMRVYTSAQKLEPFDRGNIIKSLLKETVVSRHVAEKIGSEVEGKIKDMKLEYLNTHIIREMVNVKLLEYGHEPVHSQYARIGMPVYEVRRKLSAGMFENEEILSEYNWLAEIPQKARQLHFEGAIHIFAAHDFSSRIFAASRFVPGNAEDIALEAKKNDALCTEPLTLRALNFSCVSASKPTKKKVKGACDYFGKIFSLTGKPRPAELALYVDERWEDYGNRKSAAMWFANCMLGDRKAFLQPYLSLESKYQLKLIERKSLSSGVLISNGMRSGQCVFGNALYAGEKHGISQPVGVNLRKVAEQALGREEKFSPMVEEIAGLATEIVAKKMDCLSKRPYFEKWMEAETEGAAFLSGLWQAALAIRQDDPPSAATEIINAFHGRGLAVSALGDDAVARRFGVKELHDESKNMLLKAGAKARKAFAFAYAASSLKEAEALLEECPFVEFAPQRQNTEQK